MIEEMDLLRGDPQICVGAYTWSVALAWTAHMLAKTVKCSRKHSLWG